jgi:3-(methylthio)propanoyl-CoA dehydrogenase
MPYHPPLHDQRFALSVVGGVEGSDIVEAVLGEAARLSSEVWAPCNASGDKAGSKIENGTVVPAPGFADAYKQFADGGWMSLTWPEEFGGQAMPFALGMAVNEMWQSANLSLGLCPLLTQAAIEAILHYGTPEQKSAYLPNLVSGAWTGTMHLTEPQAGTDLAAIRSVATKSGDHYTLKGQKIFITWGDHAMTPNIIHLVLARVDGLPEGNEGLGLFIVPKIMADGSRNDVRAVSVEHKLGIHGSPTCVMAYGDSGTGATAYLLGKEGEGLKNMFTMMNAARISVGLQGVAVAERAFQHALAYAKDRVQSTALGSKNQTRVPIIRHPDVQRMLMTMKAQTMAARALAYYAGGMIDAKRTARVDLLTPLVKAWATDLAVETASLGVQVHGGMGFVEETGAAQFYRDARILPIYEGTNGIQSNDLVFRKVLRDQGAEAKIFLAEIETIAKELAAFPGDDLAACASALTAALPEITGSLDWLLENGKKDPALASASAAPFLRQFATLAGGALLFRLAAAAQQSMMNGPQDAAAHESTLLAARFFAESLLPTVSGLSKAARGGGGAALRMEH